MFVVRGLLAIPVLLFPLMFAGCGGDDASTPTACLESPAKIETALVTAPDPVKIDGRTPISDCLIRDQPTADLVRFGGDAVTVATKLGTQAGDSGPQAINAAIQAGYLAGAIEKGSEDSDGIHAALVERVRNAATYKLHESDNGAAVHYNAGVEAGREFG